MNIDHSTTKTITITDIKGLDPVTVFLRDFNKGQGQITIICYGKAWTAYWGGMGDRDICEFFLSCDEHYLAKNLSNINSAVFDADTIREQAKSKGINHHSLGRDDPWNDWELMAEMYGPDMHEWSCLIPSKSNHNYTYLCKIINTVKEALASLQER